MRLWNVLSEEDSSKVKRTDSLNEENINLRQKNIYILFIVLCSKRFTIFDLIDWTFSIEIFWYRCDDYIDYKN